MASKSSPSNAGFIRQTYAIGKAMASRIFAKKPAELAVPLGLGPVDLSGHAGVGDQGFNEPFRRHNGGIRRQLIGYSGFGLGNHDSFLREIGKFNPLYVLPFHQTLMRRSVMPRLALILLRAALSQRAYVVEGGDARAEKFHQRWINRSLHQILSKASNAIWYGWQPYVIDWNWDRRDGSWTPGRFNDVDVFGTSALQDEHGHNVGLSTSSGRFGEDRSFWLSWEEEQGDAYGLGQALTCYPWWWSSSVALVWQMRYFERSVDPVRMAFAKNVDVFTGATDDAGNPVSVDLTEIVAEALDAAAGGDSIALPMGEGRDGSVEEMVRIEQLDLPDRADQWQTLQTFLEQRQFLATLNLPGISIPGSDASFASSREVAKTQLSLLEYISDMPIQAISDRLIPMVHRFNDLPGPPPRLKGKAFKRETEETLRGLLSSFVAESVPEIKGGKPTGKQFRVGDLVRWPLVLQSLDIAGFDPAEVARAISDIADPAPGAGGRPPELSERGEDRGAGLER